MQMVAEALEKTHLFLIRGSAELAERQGESERGGARLHLSGRG